MKVVLGIADGYIPVWRIIDGASIMVNQLMWDKLRTRPPKVDWVDSGGYQYMIRGLKPVIKDVVKKYSEIPSKYYVMLDYPPKDPIESRAYLLNIMLFEELYTKLEDKNIVPVIHFYYPAEKMLEALDHYKSYNLSFIAYGGIVPPLLRRTRHRLVSLLGALLLRKNWSRKIHVLGAGSPIMLYLLSIIGINSADTSTWRVKAAYGNILIPGAGERNVSRAKTWRTRKPTPREMNSLKEFLEKTGFPLYNKIDELIKSFHGRALINLWVISFTDPRKWGSGGFSWIETKIRKAMKLSSEELINSLNIFVKERIKNDSK